jgi:hypothetical protein
MRWQKWYGILHMDVMEGFKPTRWMNPETRPGQEFILFGPVWCRALVLLFGSQLGACGNENLLGHFGMTDTSV